MGQLEKCVLLKLRRMRLLINLDARLHCIYDLYIIYDIYVYKYKYIYIYIYIYILCIYDKYTFI